MCLTKYSSATYIPYVHITFSSQHASTLSTSQSLVVIKMVMQHLLGSHLSQTVNVHWAQKQQGLNTGATISLDDVASPARAEWLKEPKDNFSMESPVHSSLMCTYCLAGCDELKASSATHTQQF